MDNSFSGKKIALVHDFLNQSGGAERVLEVLSEMFPEAPIYTLLYDREKMHGKFKDRKIIPSYLQKFPRFLRRRYHWLMPFYMVIPETLDLRQYDLVISSTGAWMKGIVTKLNTVHVAYVHSPLRFVWDYNERYLQERKEKRFSLLIRLFLSYVRIWDKAASERPDYLIANSRYTQERITKYYRRESKIIYPPACSLSVDKGDILKNVPKDYFLIVSRLSPYKKVDLVVEAFNKMELPLMIIGEGSQEKYLRRIAKKNVTFLGWQSDESLKKYYAGARAFIFPAEDDFGITMVEAMSFGVPVIALRRGGAKEIIEEGVTGEFFDAQTVEVLANGVKKFLEKEYLYKRDEIMSRAGRFSKDNFKMKLRDYLQDIFTGKL